MIAVNYVTGKEYTGENQAELLESGYRDLRFLTFKQAVAAGLKVKKGSKGIPLVRIVVKEVMNVKTGKVEKKKLPKGFTVFNITQTEQA